MKIQDFTVVLHKIHTWASLCLNSLFLIVSITVKTKKSDAIWFLLLFIVLFIGCAALNISRDMSRKNTSKASLIFKDVCALLLSVIIVYLAFKKVSLLCSIILSAMVVVEILIVFLIIYRYNLINWIKRKKTPQKKKKTKK